MKGVEEEWKKKIYIYIDNAKNNEQYVVYFKQVEEVWSWQKGGQSLQHVQYILDSIAFTYWIPSVTLDGNVKSGTESDTCKGHSYGSIHAFTAFR